MKATLKLLNSYYFKGFFGPFFVIVFPILILFIVGNAMFKTAGLDPQVTEMDFMRNFVSGIMITTLIANGLMGLPTMIIEFKKSTLIKRIGSANITKTQFFMSVLLYQLAWSIFSVAWVMLWGGIIIGTHAGYDWTVAFNSNFGISIPFIAISLLISIALGLLIVSIANTQQAVMGITNVLYLPISFLSGGFLPKDQIDSSKPLEIISYILPTKYAVDPFFAASQNGLSGLEKMGWEAYTYPIIAILISIIFIGIVIKKFKWTN